MSPAERNIRLVVEYKGTAFSGWQIQDGPTTVQGEIVEAIYRVTGERVNLIGAGRTDAGVHALGQVANFHIAHELPAERFRDAVNFYLPDDIRVRESSEAAPAFHSRFDAEFRRYRYLVGLEKSALYREYRHELTEPPSFDLLARAARLVEGVHDFTPFCVVASRQEDNSCRIFHSRWRRMGPLLVYEIRGNRFLHSMVRSLVGAMLNLACTDPDDNPRNLTLEQFGDMLQAPTDQRIPFTAPAQGLYLVSVGYKTGTDLQ